MGLLGSRVGMVGMFPVNGKKIRLTGFLLTEPKRTRWQPSWHYAIICKSQFISIVDVTDLTLDAASYSSMY